METVPRGRVTGGGPRNPLTTFFIALVRQEFAKGGRGNKEEAEERRYWSRMHHASNRTHSTVIHVRQFLVSLQHRKRGTIKSILENQHPVTKLPRQCIHPSRTAVYCKIERARWRNFVISTPLYRTMTLHQAISSFRCMLDSCNLDAIFSPQRGLIPVAQMIHTQHQWDGNPVACLCRI